MIMRGCTRDGKGCVGVCVCERDREREEGRDKGKYIICSINVVSHSPILSKAQSYSATYSETQII